MDRDRPIVPSETLTLDILCKLGRALIMQMRSLNCGATEAEHDLSNTLIHADASATYGVPVETTYEVLLLRLVPQLLEAAKVLGKQQVKFEQGMP